MNDQPASPKPRSRRRWIWIALGIVAALVIAVVVALPMLLDPERYRGHIEQALTDATGWDAELGAIDLSVLRGLALTVSPASLSAPGDGSTLEIDRVGDSRLVAAAAARPVERAADRPAQPRNQAGAA